MHFLLICSPLFELSFLSCFFVPFRTKNLIFIFQAWDINDEGKKIQKNELNFRMSFDNLKLLRIFLSLVALHTCCVGVGLIVIPLEYYDFFGFEGYQGIFFKVQAGVFHIVMCGAYIPAAIDPVGNRILIRFSIFAKFAATIFLFSYAFLVQMVWMVLVSGIADFLMGLILVWFYRKLVITKQGR